MPNAARLFEHPTIVTAPPGPSWFDESHGDVGAMHRAIEQRLSAASFVMAVVPLPARPMEKLLAHMSRVVGWLTVAGAAIGVVIAMRMLPG